jgi:7-cyano-7-deazaguanine reductase
VTSPMLPLGQESGYPNQYEPELLFAIARSESRSAFGTEALPFYGTDIWNAWDLTWLGPGDLPVVATAQLRIPASSPNLVESKSLKLYLNSFSMSRFATSDAIAAAITADLTACTGEPVDVRIRMLDESTSDAVGRFSGECLDTLRISCETFDVDPTLLTVAATTEVEEDLHSHLLRSLCPVTGQPDMGSVRVRYRGPRIDPESLLRYIVSFREHNDFHEACTERMFVDILERCTPRSLSVYTRFQRRGGIDINPFRSNFEDSPQDLRLWRQ